jgi:hypothetical protein
MMLVFENCLFYDNESKLGGGAAIFSYYSYTTITNCTFVKNTVEVSGIISFPYYFEGNTKITNNIFWNNNGNNIGYDNYTYGDYVLNNAIEGGYVGFGNINLSSENTGLRTRPILQIRIMMIILCSLSHHALMPGFTGILRALRI